MKHIKEFENKEKIKLGDYVVACNFPYIEPLLIKFLEICQINYVNGMQTFSCLKNMK